MKLVLASASPRRAELLRQIQLQFSVKPQNIDETVLPGERPPDYVNRLSVAKAGNCEVAEDEIILAADTIVVCKSQILGKPGSKEQALEMLLTLSDCSHEVMTSMTVRSTTGERTRLVTTSVRFREVSQPEALAYWETGEPLDKAGAYGIQGIGAIFVASIHGSYSNVVGLPIMETAEMLAEFGVSSLNQGRR